MHVGLDRLIELARQASPDKRMRLIRAFRQVAEVLQEVIRVREEMHGAGNEPSRRYPVRDLWKSITQPRAPA